MMIRAAILSSLVSILLVCFSPMPAHGQTSPRQSASATLRPGDRLRITVWRNPELSGDIGIDGNGTLQHPLYRNIVVTDAPLPVVRQRLDSLLREFEQRPQFVIEPLLRVAVGGEVRTPNIYALAPEVTVAEAVVLGGGPTERGRLDRVSLRRGGEQRMLDLTRGDLADSQLLIRSGDEIAVGRRRNILTDVIGPWASVLGAVGWIVTLARNQ